MGVRGCLGATMPGRCHAPAKLDEVGLVTEKADRTEPSEMSGTTYGDDGVIRGAAKTRPEMAAIHTFLRQFHLTTQKGRMNVRGF